jgi:hypothetical protein
MIENRVIHGWPGQVGKQSLQDKSNAYRGFSRMYTDQPERSQHGRAEQVRHG